MFVLRSVIYKSLGDEVSVEKSNNEALKYFNNNLENLYNWLGIAFLCFEMYKEAEDYCKKAINMSPKSGIHHFNLGKIYMEQKRPQEAKSEFEKGLELSSGKQHRKYKKYFENEFRKRKQIVESSAS